MFEEQQRPEWLEWIKTGCREECWETRPERQWPQIMEAWKPAKTWL